MCMVDLRQSSYCQSASEQILKYMENIHRVQIMKAQSKSKPYAYFFIQITLYGYNGYIVSVIN